MKDEIPPVTLVGIGPGGDDRYLTVGALAVLNSAEEVWYPGDALGERIRRHIAGQLFWGRRQQVELREGIRQAAMAGRSVAWLYSGDPSLYSGEPGFFGSLSETTRWLESVGLRFRVVPGVSSVSALLARLGLEHATPEHGAPLCVYAPGRDTEDVFEARLRASLALGWPHALLFPGERLERIVQIALEHLGPSARLVLGQRVSWPDEHVLDTNLGDFVRARQQWSLARQSLLLLGPWNGPNRSRE